MKFSVAVRLFLARILRQVKWWSVPWFRDMTSKVAHGQAIFGKKCMFFQHLSGIKVKLVDKMMQSNYLCVILHVKRKKLFILTVLTWSLILDKIQDGGGDGDHVWWRHRSPAAPPLIKYTSFGGENQRISTEGKIVSKYCNRSKTLRGEGGHQPPPTTCTTIGVWLCMYVRGPRTTP